MSTHPNLTTNDQAAIAYVFKLQDGNGTKEAFNRHALGIVTLAKHLPHYVRLPELEQDFFSTLCDNVTVVPDGIVMFTAALPKDASHREQCLNFLRDLVELKANKTWLPQTEDGSLLKLECIKGLCGQKTQVIEQALSLVGEPIKQAQPLGKATINHLSLPTIQQRLQSLAAQHAPTTLDGQAIAFVSKLLEATRAALHLPEQTSAQALLNQLGSPKPTREPRPDQVGAQVYAGRISLGAECVELSFEAPTGASEQEIDAALLAAFAQVAQIDIVAMGDTDNQSDDVRPSRPRG